MTNHCHLLGTPQAEEAISKMMPSLDRMYVRYLNFRYHRSGTLWEGRITSSLLQSERYLLELYRYMELHPVRAAMVKEPSGYSWSSYQCNAPGKTSELQIPHQQYLAFGKTAEERQSNYPDLFRAHIETELLEKIRKSVNQGLALGDERFTTQIEQLTSQRPTPRKKGRPRKEADGE